MHDQYKDDVWKAYLASGLVIFFGGVTLLCLLLVGVGAWHSEVAVPEEVVWTFFASFVMAVGMFFYARFFRNMDHRHLSVGITTLIEMGLAIAFLAQPRA